MAKTHGVGDYNVIFRHRFAKERSCLERGGGVVEWRARPAGGGGETVDAWDEGAGGG